MRLLLVLPLTAQIRDGRVHVDDQACNGLRLWLKNFDAVILACPAEYHSILSPDASPIDKIEGQERLTFVPLPVTYTPHRFAVALPSTVRTLRRLIDEADYLHFAIGGLWGDWGSVACLLTGRRPFAVWTDRVEYRVVEFSAEQRRGLRKLYTLTTSRLMKHYQRALIRRSALGLFNGGDCFAAYSAHCPNPHLVYNLHLEAMGIAERPASAKLRIMYAGRVHHEKGVIDWIEATNALRSLGVDFEATWYGEGPELDTARSLAGPNVSFRGPLSHDATLSAMQCSDVLMFCHKTPESPRCLPEALICGLPIFGYSSPYPAGLIAKHGGGLLTPPNDPGALAAAVARNAPVISDFGTKARRDGTQFSAEKVFAHRSELMKSLAA